MTREKAMALLKALKNGLHETGKDFPYRDEVIPPSKEALDMAIKTLEQEPRKGHWIVDKWGNISCSECGCNALYDKVYTDNSPSGKAIRIKSTFCPTCGADMREVEDGKEM